MSADVLTPPTGDNVLMRAFESLVSGAQQSDEQIREDYQQFIAAPSLTLPATPDLVDEDACVRMYLTASAYGV